MDVELCFICEKIPSECKCEPPGPIAIAIQTRPCDWNLAVRNHLFTEQQIAADQVLQRRLRNGT